MPVSIKNPKIRPDIHCHKSNMKVMVSTKFEINRGSRLQFAGQILIGEYIDLYGYDHSLEVKNIEI